ncbi:MAG TPA: septum formation initiator family protein [Patescibacteria group bacterium]|nr:septum formation initiator family protein [Patescibacteria group bacterium]
MEWKRKKKQFSWFRLGLLSLIGYFVYICIGQQYQLYTTNREAGVVQRQLEQMQQTHQELADERERLNDTKYIEKLAREQMGLVKAGEVPFISGGGTGKK